MLKTKSGKICSSLAWGTGAVFGHSLKLNRGITLIKVLLDNGIIFFDSGPSYARGKSQRLLARSLKSNNVNREDILISSKIGSVPSRIPFGKTKKNYNNSSFDYLIETTLNDFKTNYLDIIFLHSCPSISKSNVDLQYLVKLKQKGKVRYIGLSAHNKDELKFALKNHKYIDIVMTSYNLINYKEVENYLSEIKRKNIKIIGSSPFEGGLLSNKKKFQILSNFKSDLFYFLKKYFIYSSKDRKKAAEFSNEIIKNKNLPIEFSLKSKLIDITIFSSLSKQSIISICDLNKKIKI